ncbi:MAG: TrkA family potassium uptake protein [Mycoplasmataceae bacterium]|nr:TrkA family potassium uptake protein [Mycoplasmataceae bacterium]
MARKDICVIGMGRFGNAVASKLIDLDQNVLTIDRDEQKLLQLKDRAASSIIMDAADMNALKAAGVANIDTVVVGVGDNIEIIAALLELKIKHIIARAKTHRHARVLRQIGVDVIIRPEEESGTRTALIATNANFINFSHSLKEIGDGFVIGSTTVQNEKYIGIQLKELSLNKKGITIVLVKNNSISVLPNGLLKLNKDSIVTIVGKVEHVTKFIGLLNKNIEPENKHKLFGTKTQKI